MSARSNCDSVHLLLPRVVVVHIVRRPTGGWGQVPVGHGGNVGGVVVHLEVEVEGLVGRW